MDVVLIQKPVYDLPSNFRATALVYDGSRNLELSPGPGPDRDLLREYGELLEGALDTERRQLPGRTLDLGHVARVHPGKLHCDFLAWVGVREPEIDERRAAAPSTQVIEQGVMAALEFCATAGAARVAFGAFGRGVGEIPLVDRLELVVRTARAYEDQRFAAGRPQVVDQVIVAEAALGPFAEARRRCKDFTRVGIGAASPPLSEPPPRRARAASASASASGSRQSNRPRKGSRRFLDPREVETARGHADAYSTRTTYAVGHWLQHPKFGVGRVELVTPEGAIMVLFEDGEQRKMVHARA